MTLLKILLIIVSFSLITETTAENFYTFYFHEIDTSNHPTIKVKGAVYLEELDLGVSPEYAKLEENGVPVSILTVKLNGHSKEIKKISFLELTYQSLQNKDTQHILTIKYNEGGLHNFEGDTFLFKEGTKIASVPQGRKDYSELVLLSGEHYQSNKDPFYNIKWLNTPLKISTDNTSYTNNNISISKHDWKKYGFDSIQKFNTNGKYSILGQLKLNKTHLLLIQKKQGNSESHQWLCMLNKENKIINWLEVAYDNAEGCCNTTATLYDKNITLSVYSIYSKPELTKLQRLISEDGFKEQEKYIVTAKNGLIVREHPNLKSERVGKLPFNYIFKIIENTNIPLSSNTSNGDKIQGTWLKIFAASYPSHITKNIDSAYVFSGYTKKTSK